MGLNDQPRKNEFPLLRTKITAPRMPPEFVHRPRLTGWIDRGVIGPLTLLSAPAGYGKTNLLIEWAAKTDLAVAWLNIDREDNDPFRFFRYLIGAFQVIKPRFGEESLDFIQSTRGSSLEVGLTLLINEISNLPQEIVLVLDDFQDLDEPALLSGISFILAHIPANLHLVIASRGEPAMDLTQVRAKGRVVELGMDDLRFTGAEVDAFFQQAMGLQLPAETIQALEQRTDGWITGLQMAAISLRHQSDPSTLLANLQDTTAHYLVDFLAEEVLDRQPGEIRQFLLRSSILNRMTGPLCEAVVNPDAQPGYGVVMLNRLEHANLFIAALDEKHEWFSYHNLFADFLRHIQAEINPAETPALQKRAAGWFEQNGNLDEAIQYALASGDMDWTAKLIVRNIESMVKSGEIFPLTHWIDKLPRQTIHQNPTLSLIFAWGLIAAYHLDEARYWIEDIQQTLNQIDQKVETEKSGNPPGNITHPDPESSWNLRGGLAICQSALALLSGDSEKAAEYSRYASSFLGEENPFIHSLIALDDSLYYVLSGDTRKAIESLRETVRAARQANNLLVMVIATCQLAEMHALQGHLSQAWSTLQKVQYMAIGPGGKRLPLAGLADIGLGEILLERNELEEAKTYLERGISTSGSLWWLSNLDGMISLARYRQAQGDTSGSEAIINEASRIAIDTESSQWDDTIVSAIAVRLALWRGDLPAAEQWWKKSAFPNFSANIPLKDYPYHIYEYLVITQARLLAATGRQQGKESYLRRCVELMEALWLDAKRFQRVTSQIEILVLQASALFTLGETQRSVEIFREALALGEAGGYQRTFLDGGQPVAELLACCQLAEAKSEVVYPTVEYMDHLLASFRAEVRPAKTPVSPGKPAVTGPAAREEDGQPIVLSSREMEVLALIAEGKSNQEISAQLYLALNTVKRHAYNIYAKLGVSKRTQAVSKARQLGLIR